MAKSTLMMKRRLYVPTWLLVVPIVVCAGFLLGAKGCCIDLDQDGFFSNCVPFDCNDEDPAIQPNADEWCDGADNNCNSQIDEGCGGGAGVVSRLVIAGDSWAAGLVDPVQEGLIELGYPQVIVTYETTAIAGTTAKEWAENENGLLDLLDAALDQEPPAEILLFVAGANDLNHYVVEGFGTWPPAVQGQVLDRIAEHVGVVVDRALAGRPNLQVVLIDYDYFHYEYLAFGHGFSEMDTGSYNEACVGLGLRKKTLAAAVAHCHYAQNWGVLQHAFGDYPHPPFLLPPFTYPAGLSPVPGRAPDYLPFPGGFAALPAPLDDMPDGIHPSARGFRAISGNLFAQGLANLIVRQPWL